MLQKQQADHTEVIILTYEPFCGPLKPVMLGNKVLDFVTETKCLGIIIDNRLPWLSHIEFICRSFGRKVNLAKRLKYLTKDTLQSIYFRESSFNMTRGGGG